MNVIFNNEFDEFFKILYYLLIMKIYYKQLKKLKKIIIF